jgi:hypothetical protein
MSDFDANYVWCRRTKLSRRLVLAGTAGLALHFGVSAEARPLAASPVAAPPFAVGVSAIDHARAARCLAYAIYYEAGNQSVDGQKAVAQVVLNRVRDPAFPRTVCGVVFQGARSKGCQFTFACDGSMTRRPEAAAWQQAEAVAEGALSGTVMAQVGVATYYHADYVSPNWSNLSKTAKVGVHIFYTRPDEPYAELAERYAGGEPLIDVKKLVGSAMVASPPEPDLTELLDFDPHPFVEPHAADDVGGRVDVGHGWTPAPPPPKDDAMARILAAQGGQ